MRLSLGRQEAWSPGEKPSPPKKCPLLSLFSQAVQRNGKLQSQKQPQTVVELSSSFRSPWQEGCGGLEACVRDSSTAAVFFLFCEVFQRLSPCEGFKVQL